MNDLNTLDIRLIQTILEVRATDLEYYIRDTDYGVKFDDGEAVARADQNYLRDIRDVQAKLDANI